MRGRTKRPVILAAAVIALSACAGPTPTPVVAAAPIAIETSRPKPRRIARIKRPDTPCAAVKIDLPQDRKEALFREFDAAVGTVGASSQPSTPAPMPDCRQASR